MTLAKGLERHAGDESLTGPVNDKRGTERAKRRITPQRIGAGS